MKGGVTEATNLIVDLRENHNLFCSIVVYPVIPRGEIILRVIPTAAHTLEDVNYTIEAFKSVRDKLESGFYRDKPIPERFRSRNFNLRAMRSPARILFVLFTLLLTVLGEPVLGARTKVIVPSCRRADPCPKRLTASASPSGCRATGVAVWRLRCTASDGANGVAALSADELAARGVPRLDDVVRAVAGSGSSPLFGTLPVRGGAAFGGGACRTGVDPAAWPTLRTCGGVRCGRCIVRLLRTGRNRIADGLWSRVPAGGCLADRGRCGGVRALRRQIVQSPPLRLVAGRDGQGRCAGAVSAPDARRIEIRRETVAQRRPADRGLGCQFGRGCRRDAGLWRRFHRDRRSGIDWRSMTFCPTAPPFRPSFCRVEVFAVCGSDGKRRKERSVRDSRRLHGFYWGIKKLQQNALQLFSVFRRNQRMSCFLRILTICGRITSRIRP